ncbi:ankyrin repeat-containing domain protein [Xylaria arbuscula]|nr:ankyrin repeat-containing domain protein [Xylaria arbuscula]
MASRGHLIPAWEWDRHKQTILDLYNEKSLKDVRVEMEERYGFKARQVLLWFLEANVWGFRKNTKRAEWEACLEQASNPEHSQRTPAGREKPPSSFKRARRYLKATQDISIIAPGEPSNQHPSPVQDAAPSHESIDPVQITNGNPNSINLPFDFENTYADLGAKLRSASQTTTANQTNLSSTCLESIHSDPLALDLAEPALESHFDCNFLFDSEGSLVNLETEIWTSGRTTFADQVTAERSSISGPIDYRGRGSFLSLDWTLPNLVSNEVSFSSHFSRFEEFLIQKGISFTQPGPSRSGSLSLLSGGFSSRLIAEVVLSKQQALNIRAIDLEKALNRLETLIPEESTTLITKDQAFESKFTRILLFSMLNGFAGLNHIPVGEMLRFLGRIRTISRSFLIALKNDSTPASRTFVDTIFRASIEANDQNTLKQFLEHGLVDVNATVFFLGPNKYTPIERASSLRDHSLIETLLHYGADANKTWSRDGEGGALAEFLGSLPLSIEGITATSDIIETIDLLVKAGGRVIFASLPNNIFTICNIAYSVCQAIHPWDHKAFFQENKAPLIQVAQYADEIQAWKIICHMIELCKTSSCNKCLVDFSSIVVTAAATEAAKLGHLKVVELLINHAPTPTTILCAAISSNNKDLINFVLSFNPDLNPPAQYLSGRKTTPLAEAVKTGNKELIKYLCSRGALTCLYKGGRITSLIIAAARSENISLMRQLLFYCNNSSCPRRVPPLEINLALRNGDEDIAWLLLENGVGIQGARSLLCAALESQNKPLVQAILNADLGSIAEDQYHEAIKWGDISIIMDLTLVYPPYFHSQFHPLYRPLEDLCRHCIQNGKIDFFRNFIESSSIPNEVTLTSCLEIAVGMEHPEMICYLLDIGANPFTNKILRAAMPRRGLPDLLFNKSRRRQYVPKCIGASVISTVLDESLESPQSLDSLLETRAVNFIATECLSMCMRSNKQGDLTPLGFALWSSSKNPDKDPWVVKALLDAGSDPNGIARRFQGYPIRCYTGLMLALETTRHDVVQLLISNGGNINLKPRFAVKQTPLQYAAELGHLDMVRMLLEQGAEVNAEPAIRSGGTALQFAALSGNCNIANELLDNGAYLDALPSRVEGRWPLEGAAEHGRLDMIEFLWAAASDRGGSDVVAGFQRRHCLRAMNFARINGHMGCRDLISTLSGISVDRLDVENYGAPWLAFSDLNPPSSNDLDIPFPINGQLVDNDYGSNNTDGDGEDEHWFR